MTLEGKISKKKIMVRRKAEQECVILTSTDGHEFRLLNEYGKEYDSDYFDNMLGKNVKIDGDPSPMPQPTAWSGPWPWRPQGYSFFVKRIVQLDP
jgi:hypothetical protein